jgi:hypothetical protein
MIIIVELYVLCVVKILPLSHFIFLKEEVVAKLYILY